MHELQFFEHGLRHLVVQQARELKIVMEQIEVQYRYNFLAPLFEFLPKMAEI